MTHKDEDKTLTGVKGKDAFLSGTDQADADEEVPDDEKTDGGPLSTLVIRDRRKLVPVEEWDLGASSATALPSTATPKPVSDEDRTKPPAVIDRDDLVVALEQPPRPRYLSRLSTASLIIAALTFGSLFLVAGVVTVRHFSSQPEAQVEIVPAPSTVSRVEIALTPERPVFVPSGTTTPTLEAIRQAASVRGGLTIRCDYPIEEEPGAELVPIVRGETRAPASPVRREQPRLKRVEPPAALLPPAEPPCAKRISRVDISQCCHEHTKGRLDYDNQYQLCLENHTTYRPPAATGEPR